MSLKAEILNANDARDVLRRLGQGVRVVSRTIVRVGTNEPYGFGIVFGRHRGGRLARRAGGTFSLPSALEDTQPEIVEALVVALPQGDEAVDAALLRLGNTVARRTKEREAVVSGNLRRSYHVTVERR